MEKTTRNLTDGKVNFHVHNFILNMELTGNEMLVYAFIYSFSQSDDGLYYGTQKYVSETLGISERTVLRVYKSLKEKGLIESYNNGKIKGIRALVPKLEEKTSAKKERAARISENFSEATKTVDEIEDSLPYFEERFAPIVFPNIETLTISAEQYKKLRELVPRDVLYGYARRFDKYIYKRLEGMLPTPRSHYKMLRAWIEEDFGA